MALFELIYLAGRAGLRKLSRPIASSLRKFADTDRFFQQSIAQSAKRKQIEEKEVIDMAAQDILVYTIAGSALVYYYHMRIIPQQKEKEWMERLRKHRQEWGEVRQEVRGLYEKLPPKLAGEQEK